MTTSTVWRRCALLLAAAVTAPSVIGSRGAISRTISKASLEDRIRGGWAWKMIGVYYRAAGRWRGRGGTGRRRGSNHP